MMKYENPQLNKNTENRKQETENRLSSTQLLHAGGLGEGAQEFEVGADLLDLA
jgi:hypothetical protein